MIYLIEYTDALIPYAVPSANTMLPSEVADLTVSYQLQYVPTTYLL